MADSEPPNEPASAQGDQPKRRGRKKGSKNAPDTGKGLYGRRPVGRPRKVTNEVQSGSPSALTIFSFIRKSISHRLYSYKFYRTESP